MTNSLLLMRTHIPSVQLCLEEGVVSTINQRRKTAALWPLLIHCAEASIWTWQWSQLSSSQSCSHVSARPFSFKWTSASNLAPPLLSPSLSIPPAPSPQRIFQPSPRQFHVGLKRFDFSPHWWAEPETLAASPALSWSCWRQAGWAGCSDSSRVTSSSGAPRSRRTYNLLTQFSKYISLKTRVPLNLCKNTK